MIIVDELQKGVWIFIHQNVPGHWTFSIKEKKMAKPLQSVKYQCIAAFVGNSVDLFAVLN